MTRGWRSGDIDPGGARRSLERHRDGLYAECCDAYGLYAECCDAYGP